MFRGHPQNPERKASANHAKQRKNLSPFIFASFRVFRGHPQNPELRTPNPELQTPNPQRQAGVTG
jgi:hypothetical protein